MFVDTARRFSLGSKPLVLDFDHQSTRVSDEQIPNVTLGIFSALAVVDGQRVLAVGRRVDDVPDPDAREMATGLWGYVAPDDVTKLGRKLLTGGNYRYTSATFDSDYFDASGNATAFELTSVAAVNSPFISGLAPLATFSKMTTSRLVSMSTGVELRTNFDRSNTMGKIKSMIRDRGAAFSRRVDKKMAAGMSREMAMLAVDKECPGLYDSSTPAGALRFDDAGQRIPIGTPTHMPSSPLKVTPLPGKPFVTQWTDTPTDVNRARDLHAAIKRELLRLFPGVRESTRESIAVAGTKWVNAGYEVLLGRAPELKVPPPTLSPLDQGRLAAALRNLDANLAPTYVDRGPLE